jgi:hypothetical protein
MRYVYACVRVPIEIAPDGRQIPHNDRTCITFEDCDELPEETNKADMKQAFQDYLKHKRNIAEPQPLLIVKSVIIPEPPQPLVERTVIPEPPQPPVEPTVIQEEPVIVLRSEIKNDSKSQLKNSTFKNRPQSGFRRHSCKMR